MAESYGLGANHPTPAEVGADQEPAILDPATADGKRAALLAEMKMHAERMQLAETAYFGPFGVGDTVSINGSVPVYVVEVTPEGVRAQRPVASAPSIWYPKGGMSSVSGYPGGDTAAQPSSVDSRVVADSYEGDPSLPMRPPPVQPGGEGTFR
jgi:hypothetical protein